MGTSRLWVPERIAYLRVPVGYDCLIKNKSDTSRECRSEEPRTEVWHVPPSLSSLLSSTITLCPSFHTSSTCHFPFISEEDRENMLRARESGKGVLTALFRLLKTNYERIQATDG
ncbi:hypothetical protein S83_007471, partial [Arachis hypogaea]